MSAVAVEVAVADVAAVVDGTLTAIALLAAHLSVAAKVPRAAAVETSAKPIVPGAQAMAYTVTDRTKQKAARHRAKPKVVARANAASVSPSAASNRAKTVDRNRARTRVALAANAHRRQLRAKHRRAANPEAAVTSNRQLGRKARTGRTWCGLPLHRTEERRAEARTSS